MATRDVPISVARWQLTSWTMMRPDVSELIHDAVCSQTKAAKLRSDSGAKSEQKDLIPAKFPPGCWTFPSSPPPYLTRTLRTQLPFQAFCRRGSYQGAGAGFCSVKGWIYEHLQGHGVGWKGRGGGGADNGGNSWLDTYQTGAAPDNKIGGSVGWKMEGRF